MEIAELLDSKIYVKPQGGVAFKSPNDYLAPFIKMVEGNATEIRIATAAESKNANEDAAQSMNVAYGRVLVEAKLPESYTGLDHDTVVGIIYALDTQKPIIKTYTGQLARACTNLSIFQADQVFEASLLNIYDPVYTKLDGYLQNADKNFQKWKEMIEALQDTQFDREQVDEKLGFMLRKGLKQNFTQGVIAAAKELDNHKSPYAIKGETTTAWNVLSACTQYITDKTDIAMKPDVTLFAGSMFRDELKLKGISLN